MKSERGCTCSLSQFIFTFFIFREPPHGSFLLRTTELQPVPVIFSCNCLRQKQQPNPFKPEISSKMSFTRNARRVHVSGTKCGRIDKNLDLRTIISTEGSHTSYVRGARACLLCILGLNLLGYQSHLLQRCHPACGHEGSSHIYPVLALRIFISMQVEHSYNSSINS